MSKPHDLTEGNCLVWDQLFVIIRNASIRISCGWKGAFRLECKPQIMHELLFYFIKRQRPGAQKGQWSYGILVEEVSSSGHKRRHTVAYAKDISTCRDEAYAFYKFVAQHAVLPMHLLDVIDDFFIPSLSEPACEDRTSMV